MMNDCFLTWTISTGAPIYDPLSDMVDKINGRPTLLINPRLKDKPSSGDVMTVSGRNIADQGSGFVFS